MHLRTLLTPSRIKLLSDLVNSTKDIPGDMAEIGVYRGGSSFLIASTNPNKILYACDSFEGLPQEDSSVDKHKKGQFKTSFEKVKRYLSLPNVRVIKGFFPDQVIHAELYNKAFSFVHLDVDLFRPTLECLDFFYNRLSPGGVLTCDDYKWRGCPGIELAFNNFMKDKPEKLMSVVNYNCYFVKK